MSSNVGETPDDWTPEQERVFSRLYRHMVGSQAAFTHPRAEPIEAEHWQTTCWNAAWAAAHTMNPDAPYMVHEDESGTALGAEVCPGEIQ